jgi:hypothetical protein
VDAARAAVIGDSVWDVHAARRAGLVAIAVESGGVCAADLRAAGAVRVYPSVEAIGADLSAAVIDDLRHGEDATPHRTGEAQAAVNRELDPPV